MNRELLDQHINQIMNAITAQIGKKIEAKLRFTAPWPVTVEAINWNIWGHDGLLSDEVYEWIENHTHGEWDCQEMFGVVCFESDVDAVLFRFRWS